MEDLKVFYVTFILTPSRLGLAMTMTTGLKYILDCTTWIYMVPFKKLKDALQRRHSKLKEHTHQQWGP